MLILDKARALDRIVARAIEPRLPEALALPGRWRQRAAARDQDAMSLPGTAASRDADAAAEAPAILAA